MAKKKAPGRMVWCIIGGDGYDSGPICVGHYTTEKKARLALSLLRLGSIDHRRKEVTEALHEIRANRPPWWAVGKTIDKTWADKEVADATDRFDREHGIEAQPLDPL